MGADDLSKSSGKLQSKRSGSGPIATDFAGGIIRDNAGYNANVKAFTAFGRVGEPDDIITAQRIEVSGGMGL